MQENGAIYFNSQRPNSTLPLYVNPYNSYINQQSSINQFLKCRPVSSKEEAKVAQIDLDGSLWVFPDIGNNKIYTKQINNDGTASFKTYVFTEEPQNESSNEEYVTKEQLNKTIQKILLLIQPSNVTGGTQSNIKINSQDILSF